MVTVFLPNVPNLMEWEPLNWGVINACTRSSDIDNEKRNMEHSKEEIHLNPSPPHRTESTTCEQAQSDVGQLVIWQSADLRVSSNKEDNAES